MDISSLYTQRISPTMSRQAESNNENKKFINFMAEVKEATSVADLNGQKEVKQGNLEDRFSVLIGGRIGVLPLIKPVSGAINPTPDNSTDLLQYQQYIDQMTYLANQASNQMTDADRARASKEFEDLTADLIRHIEKSGMFGENGMRIISDYIESFDISDKVSANETFNNMYNLNNYIDGLDGTYEPPVVMDTQFGQSLEELIRMANQSSNYMSDANRAELNERFNETMNNFLDELEDSGMIENDVVMSFMRDFMGEFDISNRQDAQRVFNEMYNMKDYLQSLQSVTTS